MTIASTVTSIAESVHVCGDDRREQRDVERVDAIVRCSVARDATRARLIDVPRFRLIASTGPNSIYARQGAKAGLPEPKLPAFRNLDVEEK